MLNGQCGTESYSFKFQPHLESLDVSHVALRQSTRVFLTGLLLYFLSFLATYK